MGRLPRFGSRSAARAPGRCAPLPPRRRWWGRPFDLAHVDAAANAALEDASPFDDAYASAWYRRRVLPVHIRRALLGDAAEPKEESR